MRSRHSISRVRRGYDLIMSIFGEFNVFPQGQKNPAQIIPCVKPGGYLLLGRTFEKVRELQPTPFMAYCGKRFVWR